MDICKRTDMIRALVPAVISFQIPVKLGVKLVAQTAALFWSLDHVFCNFEAVITPIRSIPLPTHLVGSWAQNPFHYPLVLS